MTTWLLIHCSTHTSLVSPSDTQPKPFSLQCTINLFRLSLINKSLVCASSIFLQPVTPSTTTYYSKDCLPGSVLLTLLSFGFNPIYLLAPSPLRHQKHHPNHTHSPVVLCKVQFLGPPVYPLHYSTQFTHQSILRWPSLIHRWHPIIHLLLSKQLLRIHKPYNKYFLLITKKTRIYKTKLKPWLTASLLKCCKTKNKLYRAYLKHTCRFGVRIVLL